MSDVLTWPEGILPSGFKWTLQSNGTSFTSPFNKATQTVTFPGSQWKASITLDSLDDFESREIEALLVSLDGYGGRIKLWDMGRWSATVLGTPKVSGANQTGTKLVTKGWTANKKVLSRGDYVTVNDELKMVLSDATSNASGVATLVIGPMWRSSPADGAAIEVAKPYGIFRLDKDENGVTRKPAFDNGFSIDFVEAFY